MERIVINVDPMGKPRMTRRDKWKKRPVVTKYNGYKDIINLNMKWDIGDVLDIHFIMPMPKSWSKKKKEEMNGKPHKNKPDLDNLIKGVKDAVLKEDSHVWKYIEPTKRWGYEGKIIIQKTK